jgi:poly(A) polymerase Pap1
MPNLVRIARKIDNLLRQFVMRVREHKNSNHQYLRKAGTQEWKDHFGILPAFLLSSAILHRVI